MAQDVHSTRDVMKNQDYGVAPSLRLGIGTPTEVTLNALFAYNDDMPDYGLPPVNGAPAAVNRKNFYGATDDRTLQERGQPQRDDQPQAHADATVRNQTQYSYYRINARESGPNNVGTINASGVYTMFPATNLANGTALPLESLYVGIGSHDRIITDWSLYNQTDLVTNFSTGPIRHQLIAGLEFGWDENDTNNTSRNIPGNPNALFRVVSLTDPAYEPAGSLPSVHGQQGFGQRHRRRALHQRHDVDRRSVEGRGRDPLRQLPREPHQHHQPAAVRQPGRSASPACARA
jgi:catecholate siderophore receptor